MRTLVRELIDGRKEELITVFGDETLLSEVQDFEDLFHNKEGEFYCDCDGNFEFRDSDTTLDFDDYKYYFINEYREIEKQ